MESVAAEDYYSAIDKLKNDIIQDHSKAFSSIIEKYICLSHGLQPPDVDIEQFYGGTKFKRKLILKFLNQHKPDSSLSSTHVTSNSSRSHTASDTIVEYSEQIQETVKKRKIELGLPDDCELREVVDSDCDTEFSEPSNLPNKYLSDEKMFYEKNVKNGHIQTRKMKRYKEKKSDERVPSKMIIKQTTQNRIATCGQKGNETKGKVKKKKIKEVQKPLQDEEEKVSQVMEKINMDGSHKRREVNHGNVKENSSQDKKEFDSERVYKTDDTVFKKHIRVNLKRLNLKQKKFECDGSQRRIMKERLSDVLEVQNYTQDTFEGKQDEANILDNSVSQNKVNKASKAMKELSSKVTYKARDRKIILGNNDMEIENNSAEILNSAKESVEVNTGRGMSTTHLGKDAGHKNDTKNKRKLSDKVTKSHSMSDRSKALQELVDVRPGNCTVVLTEAGDTIFIPPMTQHEKGNLMSCIRKVSGENNPPVFFVTFNVQDQEVSQPMTKPLNATADAECVILESSHQRESKVGVTPHKKSNSCNGDKSIMENEIIKEQNKNSLHKKINYISTLNAAATEPTTIENCQKKSRDIVLPNEKMNFSEDGKSKRKSTQMEKIEEICCLSSEQVKETMNKRRGTEKNNSMVQDNLQSLSAQKSPPVGKGLENDTSSSKTIICSQPKDIFCSQKENIFFNESPSQNISHVGLKERKKRNEKTLITSYKRAEEAVDNEISEMTQLSPPAATHSILNGESFPSSLSGKSKSEISRTFCKDTLSQSIKKRRNIIVRKGLSVSKGRIVLELFDRKAQKKFDIIEEDISYNNEKLSEEEVHDDTGKCEEIASLRVPNLKSTASSDIGEICQEQCSIPNNILKKDAAKELNKEWHIREEESILAGIDAVKRKRKSFSSRHPLVFGHRKDFMKAGHLGDHNSLTRSILPEVSSIVEDITVPLVSSTKLEMLNSLAVSGATKRKIPKPQNEPDLRRKVGILCPIVAKKPKLDKSQQLLKNCTPEGKSSAYRKPNLVVNTDINISVNSSKQTDTDASKIKDNHGKYLVNSSRKKNVPSDQENYSDTDEELSLLPVEPSSTVVGPFCTSLHTVSKLWSTLHNPQLQNSESERVKPGLRTINSTVSSNVDNISKVHKKSQSFWELDEEEEVKTYTQHLPQGHKHSFSVMQKSITCATQNSSNFSANLSSTPSYRLLGGERWLAAIKSMKNHKKPFLKQSSLSLIKNKR